MKHQTLLDISQSLQAGTYSSETITRYYLERAKALNPLINSYITLTEEIALRQARAADQRLAQGNAHPLCGVPIAHKDLFCTEGIKTSCGSKMLDNFVAPYESTVTQICKDAGMVLLGKANMDEFAMGSSNENSYYGPVKNPWHLAHSPGGSSGGSAAAVAAGLAPIATGSDTGGSVRQPAAFCGLTGLKPTYGRLSRYGMIAFASSLDQAGILAQNCEDAAHLLQLLAKPDDKDATSVRRPADDYLERLPESPKNLTLGIPRHFFETYLDTSAAQALEGVIDCYQSLGVTCQNITLPYMDLTTPTYYAIASAECSANLSRYDGVRYGYRCESPRDLDDLYTRSRSEAFGLEVKRRIMIGTHVLSSGYYDAYYLQAQKVRRLIRDSLLRSFSTVDAILLPTTPRTASKLGKKSRDPASLYLSDIFTTPANLAGLPALSVPAGFHEGLPLGVQLLGPHFSEALLLQLGHQLQQHSHWHQHTPPLWQEH